MNINREEALRRLRSPNNLANRLTGEAASVPASKPSPVAPSGSVDIPSVTPIVQHVAQGSQGRGASVPEGQRDLIARAALLGLATQAEIGHHFGVTQKDVSWYKNGKVGGIDPTDERKAAHGKRVEEIRDLALEKTMMALGLCEGDKMLNMEPKELGKFAKDMAGVYNQLAPKDAGDGKAPIQLLVYAPKVQDESRYKVVDV